MQPNSYAPPPTMPGTRGGFGGVGGEKNVAEMVKENTNIYSRKFQALLDRSTPHVMERWLVTMGLFLLFALSVILRQGVGPAFCVFYRKGRLIGCVVVHHLLCFGYIHPQPLLGVLATSLRSIIGRRPSSG